MLFKSKGGNHLQFNVLSIPAGAASNIKTAYLAIAGQNDLTFKAIDGPQQVQPCLAIGLIPDLLIDCNSGSFLCTTFHASQAPLSPLCLTCVVEQP